MENEVDMNDQKTCRHNCAKYDVAEPKNCYKNLQCAKQEGCKIQTATGWYLHHLFHLFTLTIFRLNYFKLCTNITVYRNFS